MRILIVLPSIFTFFFFYSFSFAQNVGVGTTTPLEKLDVQGNIKVDTIKPNALLLTPDAGAGKILTSDDAGNATWQPMMTSPPNNESGNVGYGVWGDCETNGNISSYQPMTDTAASNYMAFGISVSLSGQFAIVGASGDNEGVPFQGSASIFRHNGISWELFQKLTDPSPVAYDNFGRSVSISGDYALVGSPEDDDNFSNQGSASFYHFNGSSWDLLEKIYQDAPGANNRFGWSVFISGDYAIIGSPNENNSIGSASIYQLNGPNWLFMQQITDAAGAASDNFGYSVSLSGNRAIVGATGDDIGSNVDQGSASIYQFDGSTWNLMQKITLGLAGDNFGRAVAISGNVAVIGAPFTNNNYVDQGSATVYHFNGTNWLATTAFGDPAGNTNQQFGTSVQLSGEFAIAGAPLDLFPGTFINYGSAYIYRKLGPTWRKFQIVTDPGQSISLFGNAVALDGTTGYFLIGDPEHWNGTGKVVFGKIR